MKQYNLDVDKYIQKLGGRYAAASWIAAEARRRAEKYNNVISHAEAIRWVLSGVVPTQIKDYRNKIKKRDKESLIYAENYLSNILDEEVANSVFDSLKQSREHGHLIYLYQGVYDEYRQARVRILTRKLWYEIQEKKYRFDNTLKI